MSTLREWLRRELQGIIPRDALFGPVGFGRLPTSVTATTNKLPAPDAAGALDASWLVAKPGDNLAVDGNFDFWLEGISGTLSGVGPDTMWANGHLGSTKTVSRQTFAPGDPDGFDDSARYYSRTVVTAVAGAGNYVCKVLRIEGVHRTAGRRLALSFRGRADSARNVAVSFRQYFGTGGSAEVVGIGSQIVALTTVWQKRTIVVDIPSAAGKTIGAGGNDFLAVYFWFDAGTTYATETANLGQQSGTFDLAQVKLEIGQATPFRAPHPADAAARVARYFQQFSRTGGASVALNPLAMGHVTTGPGNLFFVPLLPMRAAPSVSFSAPATFVAALSGALYNPLTAISATTIDACGVYVEGAISGPYTASYPLVLCPNVSSTAKIICDARL